MAEALPGIRQHFQARGKAAFLAGLPRNSHGLMRGTAALFDFLIGYDLAAKNHSATQERMRVELAQEEA